MSRHHYLVAGWGVNITFATDDSMTGAHLLPAFEPFRAETGVGETLLSLTVDDTLRPVRKSERQHVRTFDTGNGDTVVDRLTDGGYQYVIRDSTGADCALLIADATFAHCRCALDGDIGMRHFGLVNAVMLAFAFAGAHHATLLIHASMVRHAGRAYAFTAKSGTGKSTQTANWLRTVAGCDLMNDDNPVLRVVQGKVVAYGTPWSGKTPCYRQTEAPLGAVVQIARATENVCTPLPPLQAFGTLLSACSAMKWERGLYTRLCDTVTAIVSTTPHYVLRCTAEPVSALVCKKCVERNM